MQGAAGADSRPESSGGSGARGAGDGWPADPLGHGPSDSSAEVCFRYMTSVFCMLCAPAEKRKHKQSALAPVVCLCAAQGLALTPQVPLLSSVIR